MNVGNDFGSIKKASPRSCPTFDLCSMHYHLIGRCGTAMASLAGMLQARGHRVTVSDQNFYPPMSTQLEVPGIKILIQTTGISMCGSASLAKTRFSKER